MATRIAVPVLKRMELRVIRFLAGIMRSRGNAAILGTEILPLDLVPVVSMDGLPQASTVKFTVPKILRLPSIGANS